MMTEKKQKLIVFNSLLRRKTWMWTFPPGKLARWVGSVKKPKENSEWYTVTELNVDSFADDLDTRYEVTFTVFFSEADALRYLEYGDDLKDSVTRKKKTRKKKTSVKEKSMRTLLDRRK